MTSPIMVERSYPHSQDCLLILAVNNDFSFLDFLRAIFGNHGYNVMTAENGILALDRVKYLRPDLVISDVSMPGLDGVELCRRLKANPATSDIPILMTPTTDDESAIADALVAGADDFVEPYAPVELLRSKAEMLINRRQKSRAAQCEAERQFCALVENSVEIVTVLDSNGTIRYESPSVESALGYSPSELIGRNAFELVHPDDVRNVIEVFLFGLEEENRIASADFRFRHKDGSWRFLESVGKRLLEEPCVEGIIVSSRDVTERKRVEAQLRQTEQLCELALDAVKDHALFLLDPTGCVVSWNSGAERIFGYRAEQVIGKHLSWFYVSEDAAREKPQRDLRTAISEGECKYEVRCVRNDGSQFWVDASLKALRDEHSELKGFLAVQHDVTESRQQQTELRQSEQLISAILDNSPSLVYVKNMEGRYILANRQFEATYGTTGVLGKTAYEIFSADVANSFQVHEQRVIESGKPIEVEESCIVDGSCRNYISTFFPLVDQTGETYAICGVATDITARKTLEDQLRHSQKMEAIGLLAGGIAHDFNNLLTAILGYSQLLLRGLEKGDPRFDQIEEIDKAGKRAAALTNQLLVFSRKQILRPKSMDLNWQIDNLSKMLRRLIGENIEFVSILDGDLGVVTADPGLLDQVIVNLVVNARDAMPQGGKLTIETANVDLDGEYTDNHLGVPNGRYVMLAISDSGCGMDKETQSRIFDPFFTTKEQGKGTGLGLSTVYGIVVQSRGHIWVYSEPDHGSTFKIYLPRIEGRVEDSSTITANISAPSSNVRATVLLVEDDEMVRKLAQVILEKSGYKVLEASAPREALRISTEFAGKIDVLVSDVVMPGMSGCDLATAITVSRPDIKILLMSGYSDEAMPQNIIPATGSEFLEKPFSANGLLSKIWELLEAKSPLGLQ